MKLTNSINLNKAMEYYFFRVKRDYIRSAANQAQKELLEAVLKYDETLIIGNPNRDAFTDHLEGIVKSIKEKHKRCKKIYGYWWYRQLPDTSAIEFASSCFAAELHQVKRFYPGIQLRLDKQKIYEQIEKSRKEWIQEQH